MTEPKKPELYAVPTPPPKKNPAAQEEKIPYKTIAITAAVVAIVGIVVQEVWHAGKRFVNGNEPNPQPNPMPALPPSQNPISIPSTYTIGVQQPPQIGQGQTQGLIPYMPTMPSLALPGFDKPAWLDPFAAQIEARFRSLEERMTRSGMSVVKNPDDEDDDDEDFE